MHTRYPPGRFIDESINLRIILNQLVNNLALPFEFRLVHQHHRVRLMAHYDGSLYVLP